MMPAFPPSEIYEIDRVDIAVERFAWPFADERRPDIEQYFSELQKLRPGVWNGRVLLLNRYDIAARALRRCARRTALICSARWRPTPRAPGVPIFAAAHRSRPTSAPAA